MTNQQRNKQMAMELRSLADSIEYDTNEVIAAVTIYPKPESLQGVLDQYVPNGRNVLYNGLRFVELTCLDDKLRVRVHRGDV